MTNTEPTAPPPVNRPTQQLSTVLGLIAGVKSQTHQAVTALHRTSMNEDRYDGFTRSYEPDAATDDSQQAPEQLPSESKIVELKGEELLRDLAGAMTRILDLQLTMDVADTNAFGDIRVPDGQGGERVLKPRVPVTTLMVMKKRLEDVRKFIRTLPTLDPSMQWDPSSADTEIWEAKPVQTIRKQKTRRWATVAPPTKEHKEQVTFWDDDVRAGVWTRIARSGRLSPERYGTLLQRVDQLIVAVDVAREEANRVPAPDQSLGNEVFRYIIDGR
jgi:hypothetical protein